MIITPWYTKPPFFWTSKVGTADTKQGRVNANLSNFPLPRTGQVSGIPQNLKTSGSKSIFLQFQQNLLESLLKMWIPGPTYSCSD